MTQGVWLCARRLRASRRGRDPFPGGPRRAAPQISRGCGGPPAEYGNCRSGLNPRPVSQRASP
eukprot:13884659-Heterocapsa_arctica.AAC.1